MVYWQSNKLQQQKKGKMAPSILDFETVRGYMIWDTNKNTRSSLILNLHFTPFFTLANSCFQMLKKTHEICKAKFSSNRKDQLLIIGSSQLTNSKPFKVLICRFLLFVFRRRQLWKYSKSYS